MADPARIEAAFRAAHAAGDTVAATKLAQALRSVRAAPAPQQPPPQTISQDQFAGRFEGEDPRNSFMGKVDATVRGAADFLSASYADEIAAGADALFNPILGTGKPGASFGDRYAQNVEGQRQIDASDVANRGGYRLAGQIAGAIAPAGLGARAIGGAATLGGKVVRGVLAGGAQGAAYGSGSAEGGIAERGQGALVGGAIGAGVGGAVPVVGNAIGKAIGGRVGRAAVPTTDQMRTASSALYKAAEAEGLRIAPGSFQRAVNDISREARAAGIDPTIHPKAYAALGRLEQAVGGQLDLQEVDTLRRVLGAAAGSLEKDERRIASQMIDKLDDYMTNLTGRDVVAGNPQAATSLIGRARQLWGRQAKGSTIETAIRNAGDAAGGLEAGLRNEFRSLLKNPRYKWTNEERAALRRVVHGGFTANALRFFGTFGIPVDQGRNWLGAVAGGTVGGAPLVAGGTAAKYVGRALQKGRASAASAVVRNGGQTPFNASSAAQAEQRTLASLGTVGQGVAVPSLLDLARR